MATIDDLTKLDIRVGEVLSAEPNADARHPAYAMTIDFGDEIGVKQSSAQLCDNYEPSDLVGTRIIAVVNFPPRRVAGFKSEVLVLAIVCAENGTVLVRPDRPVEPGQKLA
ncbi:MAG: tRNA-binding protein [bacterium]|nr:tRNA-binding protein [bacterium]